MVCCVLFSWLNLKGVVCSRGRASFLGSGWSELHGHLLGVREVLCYLATLCVIQVHLPVHLPCYDLPPLCPFGFI